MGPEFDRARRRLLQMHFDSGVGHIGGNLSCLDALFVAFHDHLRENDHFVLSKGHAAGALYVILWSMGILSDDDLRGFHQDGTLLSGHPPAKGIPRIEFATGSLGHGLSLGAGLALASRLLKDGDRTICLTSDGEWQEGSTWEGLIFAAHHRLSNLTVMIDNNRLQGFGTTSEVAGYSSPSTLLEGFDIELLSIDGHDRSAILEALAIPARTVKVIVLETTKGHGVSFMEDRMEWHYRPLTQELFEIASEEVGD